jgi:hypothetical protein
MACQNEVLALTKRRNSAYELLLYAILEIGKMALPTLAFVFTFLVISLIMKDYYLGAPEEWVLVVITALSVVPLFIAAAFGRIYVQCRNLVKCDERMAYLAKEIAELERQLRL